MKSAVVREIDEALPGPGRPAVTVPPQRPPGRLGWPVTMGVIVEVVTLAAVMVSLASGQFSFIAYGLAVLGVVTPLALVAWGFRRLVQDEDRSRSAMNGEEQAALPITTKPGQPPSERPPKAA